MSLNIPILRKKVSFYLFCTKHQWLVDSFPLYIAETVWAFVLEEAEEPTVYTLRLDLSKYPCGDSIDDLCI